MNENRTVIIQKNRNKGIFGRLLRCRIDTKRKCTSVELTIECGGRISVDRLLKSYNVSNIPFKFQIMSFADRKKYVFNKFYLTHIEHNLNDPLLVTLVGVGDSK